MKRQTRRLLLNVATGVAIAATAAVMLVPAAASAAQPSIGFGFHIGPGGPSVSIGVGEPDIPTTGQVCFFSDTRYRGRSFCVEEGNSIRDLSDWGDEISSFRNPDGLDVTVCTRTRFRGDCRTYSSGDRKSVV